MGARGCNAPGYPTRFVLVRPCAQADDGDVACRGTASSDMGWINPDPPGGDDVIDMRGGRWRWWHILGLVAAVLAAGTSLVIRNNADRAKNAATHPAELGMVTVSRPRVTCSELIRAANCSHRKTSPSATQTLQVEKLQR